MKILFIYLLFVSLFSPYQKFLVHLAHNGTDFVAVYFRLNELPFAASSLYPLFDIILRTFDTFTGHLKWGGLLRYNPPSFCRSRWPNADVPFVYTDFWLPGSRKPCWTGSSLRNLMYLLATRDKYLLLIPFRRVLIFAQLLFLF